MRNILYAAVLTAASGPLAAVETLDTIVVSATRAPEPTIATAANIQVIDREEIAASGAANLPELLRGRAGVHVRDLFGDGSNATVDMRGFGATAASNVLLLVDGRRLNPSSDVGTLFFNSVPLQEVERIEIVRGSAGVLFGNQAVGGVINVITRRPESGVVEIAAGGGSYGRREVAGSANQVFDNGIGLSIDARHLESDNYRDHNETRVRNVNVLLDHESDSGRVFIELRHLDEWQQTPGALFLDELAADRRQSIAVFADDFIDTRSDVVRIGGDRRLGASWQLLGELSYRDDNREFVQSFRTFPGSLTTQDREVWDFTPRLIGDLALGGRAAQITLGADLQRTDYLLVSAFGPQGLDQAIDAYYAQALLSLTPRWDLTAGIRHARVDNDIDDGGTPVNLEDDVTVGALGLVFRPAPGWRFYARADQNYRFAKVDEHTNPVFGQPTGIENQTGVSYEVGGRYENDYVSTSLQLYQLDLEDEISFDASGFANINLDDTRRRGLSLAVETAPVDAWLVGLNYNYIDGELTDGPNEGKRIPLVPRHRLRGYLEWSALESTTLTLEALYVDDQAYGGDFANRFPRLDGYTVVNLSGRWKRGPWSINLRIDNVFDELYSETGNIGLDSAGSGHPHCESGSCPAVHPAPERNARLTLAYQFR